MKKKLKIIIPIVLVLFGGVYKTVLAKPAKLPKPKIAGTVYVMPKEFLLNMADGRYAKLDVSLVLDKSEVLPKTEAATSDNYGALPQEPAVRDARAAALSQEPCKRPSPT